MFKQNDLVVYRSLGVCRVTGLVNRSFEGMQGEQQYYVLQPLYQGGVLYVPVAGPALALRAVITAEEANRLIDTIPGAQCKMFHSRSAQELTQHYQQAMQSNRCEDILQVLLSLRSKRGWLARQNKRLGRVDAHYMRRAEESLYSELAAALHIPLEDVPEYITQRVSAAKAAAQA